MRYILILLATVCTLCAQQQRMMMHGVIRVDTYTPFFPSDIPGLAIWLDAQTSFAGLSDGTSPATWPDKSARALTVTYTNAGTGKAYVTNSGINGKLAIRFAADGANNMAAYYVGPVVDGNSGGWTLFAVCLLPVTSSGAQSLWYGKTTGIYMSWNGLSPGEFITEGFGGAGFFKESASYTANAPFYLTITHGTGSGSPAYYRNGTNYGWTANGGASVYALSDAKSEIGGISPGGATTNLILGEFIVYTNVLAASNMTKIDTYFKSRWGTFP